MPVYPRLHLICSCHLYTNWCVMFRGFLKYIYSYPPFDLPTACEVGWAGQLFHVVEEEAGDLTR